MISSENERIKGQTYHRSCSWFSSAPVSVMKAGRPNSPSWSAFLRAIAGLSEVRGVSDAFGRAYLVGRVAAIVAAAIHGGRQVKVLIRLKMQKNLKSPCWKMSKRAHPQSHQALQSNARRSCSGDGTDGERFRRDDLEKWLLFAVGVL